LKKAVLYINQFFGQIGGEDKVDFTPVIREGLVGPALLLQQQFTDMEITHTIICGDNYINSNHKEVLSFIHEFLKDKKIDIFFAGPAFNAGRYGVACGLVCKLVKENFGLPVVTSMNEENPGVEMYRKEVYILKGGKSAAKMGNNIKKMAELGSKLLNGVKLGSAEEEGYFGRGLRHQIFLDPPQRSADRAVDMLISKLYGRDFRTELPMPKVDMVPIAPAIKDLSKITVALVTSGGIVPADNPDHIQSASATKWGKYDISELNSLPAGDYKTIHAGYDPSAANEDPNRVLPLDVMRQYEKEGRIGRLHNYYYATVGTGTTQGEAARMGKEIAEDLLKAEVSAVILTST
jgi:glycine reductase